MANSFFKFKQFTIHQDQCAMKVTTDSCFFGAWTAKEIQKFKKEGQNILDIGTGTGLLSLMIVQKNEVNIDAVEIDPECALQAKENMQASPWKDRLHVYNQNILSFASSKKYDCIVSNPPFYENELASSEKRKRIAHHSAELSLQQLLQSIKNHLEDEGVFFLMYPPKRNGEMMKLLEEHSFFLINEVLLKQSVNHPPFRKIIMAGNGKTELKAASEISVRDEDQKYTSAFVELLKDYYLYL